MSCLGPNLWHDIFITNEIELEHGWWDKQLGNFVLCQSQIPQKQQLHESVQCCCTDCCKFIYLSAALLLKLTLMGYMLQSLLLTATSPKPQTEANLVEPNIRLIYGNYMQNIFISKSIITFNDFRLHRAGLLTLPTPIVQAKLAFLSCEDRIIWDFCMVYACITHGVVT